MQQQWQVKQKLQMPAVVIGGGGSLIPLARQRLTGRCQLAARDENPQTLEPEDKVGLFVIADAGAAGKRRTEMLLALPWRLFGAFVPMSLAHSMHTCHALTGYGLQRFGAWMWIMSHSCLRLTDDLSASAEEHSPGSSLLEAAIDCIEEQRRIVVKQQEHFVQEGPLSTSLCQPRPPHQAFWLDVVKEPDSWQSVLEEAE
eukprot:2710380-Amphidinium_carterae.1